MNMSLLQARDDSWTQGRFNEQTQFLLNEREMTVISGQHWQTSCKTCCKTSADIFLSLRYVAVVYTSSVLFLRVHYTVVCIFPTHTKTLIFPNTLANWFSQCLRHNFFFLLRSKRVNFSVASAKKGVGNSNTFQATAYQHWPSLRSFYVCEAPQKAICFEKVKRFESIWISLSQKALPFSIFNSYGCSPYFWPRHWDFLSPQGLGDKMVYEQLAESQYPISHCKKLLASPASPERLENWKK